MKNYIIAIATSVALSGCATMFGESQQIVSIETHNGEKAKAKIETPDSTFVKEIPAQLTVNKGWGSVKVTVEDECYLRTTEEVGDSVEPAFWLNFFNIFVFWPVDVVTGAMWEYESSTVVTLQPKNTENCVE
jgi:hypothetical protein